MGHDATPVAPSTFHSERLGAAASLLSATGACPLRRGTGQYSVHSTCTVPVFGAHHPPRPAVALPLPSMVIEHALVSSLSLFHGFEPHTILATGMAGQSRLFKVPVRRARWGLPNIPTPTSQPLLDSNLNVEIRLCQCFPAICSIHSTPSFACFRSSVPTLS